MLHEFGREPVTLEHVHAEFIASLDAMRTTDQRGEPVFGAFADAALRTMQGADDIDPDLTHELNTVVSDFLEDRVFEKGASVEYARELLSRAFQKQALKQPNANYPFHHEDPNQWIETFTRVLSNIHNRSELEEDLALREIQTNEVQRAVGILLVAKAFPELMDEPLNIVELGCSDNLILTALARRQLFELSVAGRDAASKRWVKSAVASRPYIANAIGIDFIAPSTEWVEACRRPSELRNQKSRAERDTLRSDRPNSVSFVWADFSNRRAMQGFRQRPDYTDLHINIAAANTSIYMQKPDEQRRSLTHQREMGADIDMVLDWARPDPKDPSRLIFARRIHSGAPYNLLVRRGDDPKGAFEKLATFKTGRARLVTLAPKFLEIISKQL